MTRHVVIGLGRQSSRFQACIFSDTYEFSTQNKLFYFWKIAAYILHYVSDAVFAKMFA